MSEAGESKLRGTAKRDRTEAGVAPTPLSPGLWLVATPIGNASDITLNALDILRRADVLACEDTRRTRKLMTIHAIRPNRRPVISYNDRNGAARRSEIMRHLAEGRSVAYASDAGTPLIADPGYRLVTGARDAGHAVHVAPGPSAVLAALSLAGLPTDRFVFLGFLPPRTAGRRREIATFAQVPATLVVFESPRRLAACLADLAAVLAASRPAAVVREATKMFEEVRAGTLADLAGTWSADDPPKGEVVIVIGPPAADAADADEATVDAMLRTALATASVKDAAREVANALGLPRREVYGRALALNRDG